MTAITRSKPQPRAITTKGQQLAAKLAANLGWTDRILRICSLICRHATTHHRMMEAQCNQELSAEEEDRIEWLEARITELVGLLPEMDDGPLVAEFWGDPRGVTVKLVIKGYERHPLYDGWANEAILVPQ